MLSLPTLLPGASISVATNLGDSRTVGQTLLMKEITTVHADNTPSLLHVQNLTWTKHKHSDH